MAFGFKHIYFLNIYIHVQIQKTTKIIYEPVHEISNNVAF